MPKKIMEKTRRNQLVVILVFLIWILLIKPLLFEMQINHLWVHIISFIIVSFVFVCGFIWWKERPKEKQYRYIFIPLYCAVVLFILYIFFEVFKNYF